MLSKEAVEGVGGGIDAAGEDGLPPSEEEDPGSEEESGVTAGATAAPPDQGPGDTTEPPAGGPSSSQSPTAEPTATATAPATAPAGHRPWSHRQGRRAGPSRGIRMRGQGAIRSPGAALEPCGCGEAVLASEQAKLTVLRRMEAHLERSACHQAAMVAQLQRSNVCQEQILELKKRKLELQERQLMLAEARFIQGPPIPNILTGLTEAQGG